MSNIVHIGEHIYQKPELKRDSEVLFKDLKKQDAYWRRDILIKDYRDIWFEFIPYHTLVDQAATLYDQDGVLITLNKEDSDYVRRKYVQEFRRRTDGVWFKNGDDFEYITGDHYFLLMWAKMTVIGGGQYPEYREFQRDFFYLLKMIWESKMCLGLFVSKPKKTGITNLMWSGYFLNKATLMRNKNMGCMNINKEQAAKTYRDYFKYSLDGLPSPLRPQIKSEAPATGRIEFGKSYTNSKATKLIAVRNPDEELNNNVFCVATAAKAFDVAKMDDTWYDEPPKYEESFKEIYTTNKEAIKIGAFINGRSVCTSYTPNEDGISFREAREIFLDSKLKTIKETGTGKTRSEMWAWHIPSHKSWIGEQNDCFNKYGTCDELKANKQIDAGRAAVKDNSRLLQSIKRQYAKDEREAWSSAGAGSTFDLIRLGELLAELELNEEHAPDELYTEGKLVWENNLWEIGLRNLRKKGEFCPVRFEPLTLQEKAANKKGKIRMYNEVPKAHQNLALKHGRDQWGNLLPPPNFYYSLGGDPTAYAAKSTLIEFSKNSASLMRLPDLSWDAHMGKVSTNVLCMEYYDRPELPDEGYEDFIKMLIYTGSCTLIEGNQEWVSTRMIEEGLGNYMIVYNKEKAMTFWKAWMGMPLDEEKSYTLIKTLGNQIKGNPILEKMVALYKNYFHTPVGDEIDYGATFKSTRALKQMMDLDPTDTTKSDIFISNGYSFIAMDVYSTMLLQEQDDNQNPDYHRATLRALGWAS